MAEEMNGYGGLAAALAKAQSAFPTIPRDKEVTVQTKAGGSYKFKYAPLDSILAAVRGPLADNGLAIVQLLDDDMLVTSLLHESGAMLSGRTPLPATEGIQAFGSAITYLRRYSIQALLGIAAEEDDDGNHAAGNTAKFGSATPERQDGSLIGTGVKEKKVTTDFLVRESPEGPFLGFRIKDGLGSVICEVRGPLAVLVAAHEAEIVGQRIQVWGSFHQYEPPAVKHPYRAFRVTRMQGTFGTIPVPEGGPGDPPQAGAEAAGVTESAPDEAQALPVPPEAAGASSTEPAALSPGSAPDDQCDSASPYGDNLQCELLAGHRGAHKVLSLAFPETWTDR